MRKTTILATLTLLAAASLPAAADTVKVGNLPYARVQVLGFRGGQLSFQTTGGDGAGLHRQGDADQAGRAG
jgi:hypothetical protein